MRMRRLLEFLATGGGPILSKSPPNTWEGAFHEMELARAENRKPDRSKFTDLTKSTGGK